MHFVLSANNQFVLFRFRKHREKVSKRKKDEEDIEEEEEVPATLIPNEYQQGVPLHQQVKRRISETDFSPSGAGDDVASVCGSSVGSYEPMDLSNRSPGNAKRKKSVLLKLLFTLTLFDKSFVKTTFFLMLFLICCFH